MFRNGAAVLFIFVGLLMLIPAFLGIFGSNVGIGLFEAAVPLVIGAYIKYADWRSTGLAGEDAVGIFKGVKIDYNSKRNALQVAIVGSTLLFFVFVVPLVLVNHETWLQVFTTISVVAAICGVFFVGFFLANRFAGTSIHANVVQDPAALIVLHEGRLSISKTGMRGIVSIDWHKVDRVESLGSTDVSVTYRYIFQSLSRILGASALTLTFQSPQDREVFLAAVRSVVPRVR